MALVHESLYGSDNLAVVNFAEYAKNLSEQLVRSYCLTPGRIRLIADLEAVHMSIDLAVPCGLILNEIVTNAVKHAFEGAAGGEIRLGLKRVADDSCVLSVADTGGGLPQYLDVSNSPTMGLRLVRLLTRQIGARFELVSVAPGTQARLTVKLSPNVQSG
jgi:two-component sensor histidine kinase